MFLRVRVTKYRKLQGNLLPGSVSASGADSWAPLKQHRQNPSVQALFGELAKNLKLAEMDRRATVLSIRGGEIDPTGLPEPLGLFLDPKTDKKTNLPPWPN